MQKKFGRSAACPGTTDDVPQTRYDVVISGAFANVTHQDVLDAFGQPMAFDRTRMRNLTISQTQRLSKRRRYRECHNLPVITTVSARMINEAKTPAAAQRPAARTGAPSAAPFRAATHLL